MKPALVLLAAGASRRLGECKALVDLGGSTGLERLLAAGACFDQSAPLLVAGAALDELSAARPAGCELLHNASWRSGRSGSVLAAVRARPGLDLCLAPVDVPLVPSQVFEALLEAWGAAGSPAQGWLAPRCAGRHGHPIVIGRGLLAQLEQALEDEPGLSLRQLRSRAQRLLAVEVAAPEILDDLDTPADLDSLRRRLEPK